jgi:Family of unknown function (DUF6544)
MSGNATREPEARLLRPAGPERFGPAELDGLPGPVRRHLAQAIAPGTPLHTEARLTQRGQIKVGRWGDPDRTGSFGWHRFGGRITGYAGFGGLEVPAQGRLGWDGGEFFRYRLTGLEPSR